MSPFGYNETFAYDDLPLQKEEAINKGYKWQDNIQKTLGQETIKEGEIPQSIKDVEDSILGEILKCMDCSRNFKIIPNELIFYRRMEIPIPRRCFHCRHRIRVNRINPFKLWHRKCMNNGCSNEFETTYAPDRPEIVYCEKCYQAEIY